MIILTTVRKSHIHLMKKTCDILGHILHDVSQSAATTYRDCSDPDGREGWTVVEVVCHLRDFDGFFYHRAQMMLAQDTPALPAYDHEALAIEGNYNAQSLVEAYNALRESRQKFVAFFADLSDEQWERAGIHPETGHFTMTNAVMQVGLHDTSHIEQITRILREKKCSA